MVNIGAIFTAGRNIFHTIEYELLQDSKFIILAAAVLRPNGKTILLLSPYGTGKTSFVTRALLKGCQYISENYCVIDTKKNHMYGVSPLLTNKGRVSNDALRDVFLSKKIPVIRSSAIDEIYLQIPDRYEQKMTDNIIENYVVTYSGFFQKNNYIRTVLFYTLENITSMSKYTELNSFLMKHSVHLINSTNEILL